MSDSNFKGKYFYKKAITARFDGWCPYPLCCGSESAEVFYDSEGPQNKIIAGDDMIAKGSLGWGHAKCVNSKIHKRHPDGGGHQICLSSLGGHVRTTDDWDLVDCKKCLKKKPEIEEAEA